MDEGSDGHRKGSERRGKWLLGGRNHRPREEESQRGRRWAKWIERQYAMPLVKVLERDQSFLRGREDKAERAN